MTYPEHSAAGAGLTHLLRELASQYAGELDYGRVVAAVERHLDEDDLAAVAVAAREDLTDEVAARHSG